MKPRLLRIALGVFALCLASQAPAQEFPSRPVIIIAPAPPGGTTDLFGRLFSDELQKRLGTPVAVENKAGAGGQMGTEFVARAQADGYTILMGNDSLLTFPLFLKTALKADELLMPIALVGSLNPIMVINPKVPAKSPREFVAYAKANPGKLNAGVLPNTSQFLDMVRFQKVTGTSIQLIPYGQGYGTITRALLADEIQIVIGSPPAFAEHVKAGRIVALGIAATERSPTMPSLPTMKEGGVDFERTLWNGFFAPAGTPRPVAAKLSDALVEIAKLPAIQEKVRSQGVDPRAVGYEEAGRILAAQIKITNESAREANVKPQ